MKGTSQCSGMQQRVFFMLRFWKSGMSAMFPQFRERTRGRMARVQVSTHRSVQSSARRASSPRLRLSYQTCNKMIS